MATRGLGEAASTMQTVIDDDVEDEDEYLVPKKKFRSVTKGDS